MASSPFSKAPDRRHGSPVPAISKDDRVDDLAALHAPPYREIQSLFDDHKPAAP
jgi:hypothetical protein